MTVTLNLNPELEAGLFAQAQASGMTVEEYLHSVIESAVLPAGQHTLSAEEGARSLRSGLLATVLPLPCPITRSAATPCMKAATTDACPR